MKPLAIMTTAAAFALALMLASPVAAYAPTDTPRPKPRPPMVCWINQDTGATECEVRG